MGQALEGDADDLVVLNGRAARVAGVNRGIDLDDEVGVCAAVRVGAEVDTRDDSACDGEAITSDGVTDGTHFGVELWHASNRQVDEALKWGVVIEGDESKVAVVGNVLNRGGQFASGVALHNEDATSIGDNVRVRQDLIRPNKEACAIASRESTSVPRSAVVGVLGRDFNAED